MPVRCTKAVGSKEVRSKRRRWREAQQECLHRRAKTKLVRKGDGCYEEKRCSGGVICFSMIGCMMLFVHGVFSFAFFLWFSRRVRHSVYDKHLGNDH